LFCVFSFWFSTSGYGVFSSWFWIMTRNWFFELFITTLHNKLLLCCMSISLSNVKLC
jgi:hypothetical protein